MGGEVRSRTVGYPILIRKIVKASTKFVLSGALDRSDNRLGRSHCRRNTGPCLISALDRRDGIQLHLEKSYLR